MPKKHIRNYHKIQNLARYSKSIYWTCPKSWDASSFVF